MKFSYKTNILFLTLLGGLFSCNQASENTEKHHDEENQLELTEAQYLQADLQIGTVEKRAIGSELRVNGVIDVPPQSNISINMPYGGFIQYIDMLPGTPVKKGQLLVKIENPDFIQLQQDYLESLANREFLKGEFERQQTLYHEKVASGKNFEQAKSDYLSNEAKIKALEERLKMIGMNAARVREGNISGTVSLYAPVEGKVREVYTNIGKYIAPHDVIMDITNAEDLHVELTVYEDDIPKVKVGQRIRFSVANTPDLWREATVFLVGSGVRENRSVTIHGHLKEHYEDLLPGMYVTAKIETGSREVWAIPEDAIVRFGGKHYVFIPSPEHLEIGQTIYPFTMQEIYKGQSEDGYTEIRLLNSSNTIDDISLVTKGAFTLLAKAKNTEEEGGHHH